MNTPVRKGMPASLKWLLAFIGAVLAVLIFLLWSYIIQVGMSITDKPVAEETTAAPSETAEDAATDDGSAALEQARAAVVSMIESPACSSPEEDMAALRTFSDRASEGDGFTDDDKRLVKDALTTINADCSKDHAIALSKALEGPGTSAQLTAVALDNEWLTPARPAPDGARQLDSFNFANRNVHCILSDEQAACSIYAYGFPSVSDTCEGQTHTGFVTATGEADGTCDWRIDADTSVQDGTYAGNGFVCVVSDRQSKVECWSELSGHGFTITGRDWVTF